MKSLKTDIQKDPSQSLKKTSVTIIIKVFITAGAQHIKRTVFLRTYQQNHKHNYYVIGIDGFLSL